MTGAKKTAVVLFNLGGPDSPAAIRPFLYNFFMDKNIIRLPLPFRWVLAVMISLMRARGEAGRNYGALGGKSPLLTNTEAQASALQAALGAGFRVFISMRYWHPLASEAVRAVKEYAPDEIVLLPLYPQYSTTTTRSSFQSWDRAAQKINLSAPVKKICCWFDDEAFVAASAARIKAAVQRAQAETGMRPRVLFSAHGLPEKIVKEGDPYQEQCEKSAAAIAAAAGLRDEDWRICYQSRVGRLKWIGPSTDEEIRRAGADGVPVVIYPHAFVSEHIETLVEIEQEFRDLAKENGVPGFYRVETLGADPVFIAGLARLAKTVPMDVKCSAGASCCHKICGR